MKYILLSLLLCSKPTLAGPDVPPAPMPQVTPLPQSGSMPPVIRMTDEEAAKFVNDRTRELLRAHPDNTVREALLGAVEKGELTIVVGKQMKPIAINHALGQIRSNPAGLMLVGTAIPQQEFNALVVHEYQHHLTCQKPPNPTTARLCAERPYSPEECDAAWEYEAAAIREECAFAVQYHATDGQYGHCQNIQDLKALADVVRMYVGERRECRAMWNNKAANAPRAPSTM